MIEWGDDGALVKAGGLRDERSPREREQRALEAAPPRGLFYDPELIARGGGYGKGQFVERPTMIRTRVLRRMLRVTPVAAVTNVMSAALREFATPQDNPRLPGFAIKLRDKKRSMSRADDRRAAEITEWFTQCGVGRADEHDRLDLEGFIAAQFRDSFCFDNTSVQLVPSEGEARALGFGGELGDGLRRAPKAKPYEPVEMVLMDGETMRLASPPEDGTHPSDPDRLRYIQVDPYGLPVEGFTGTEMLWCVRNPRTSLDVAGYGYSECEQLIEVVTHWLYPWNYNGRFFKQGAQVKGLLNLVNSEGAQPTFEMRESFQRDFENMVTGQFNAHRVPLIWGGDAKWVPLTTSNRDLEFAEWMSTLTKWLCAICLIDPAEVNFVFGNTGQTGSLGNADSRAKVDVSRSRWLRPHVRHLFKVLNKVLRRLPNGEDFVVAPTGVDVESASEQLERLVKEVGHVKTLDEARAELDLDALGDERGGNLVLNPTYLQGLAMAQGGGEDGEGPDGAAGAEGGGDDEGEAPDEGDADEAEGLAARLLGGGAPKGGPRRGKPAQGDEGEDAPADAGPDPQGDEDEEDDEDAQHQRKARQMLGKSLDEGGIAQALDTIAARLDALDGLAERLTKSTAEAERPASSTPGRVRAFNLEL